MIFQHKLYGKCTLIPNSRYKEVECVNEIRLINYVDLETGELKESGVHDAGLFHFNKPVVDPEIFVDYGYCRYKETTTELNALVN